MLPSDLYHHTTLGLTPSSYINLSCATPTIDFWSKGPPFRIVIGLVCLLSTIGSLLIIFSYVFFKSLRSRARLILVHLSLMDLGVGIVNLVGNFIYFDQYYFTEVPMELMNFTNSSFSLDNGSTSSSSSLHSMNCLVFQEPNSTLIRNLCTSQAFLEHYFAQGSILWTISLSVFLYIVIVHNRSGLAKYSLIISYVVCYTLPLLVCLWVYFTHRFGYSKYNSGWCSIILVGADGNPDIYAAAFGYDIWIYLAFTLVPILYFAVQLFVREKLKQTKLYIPEAETKFWEAIYILDYKFLLIPVTFALLRIWTCAVDLLMVYIQVKGMPHWLSITLVYLASIGDSAQGFANCILFILLTKRVRKTIFNLKYWKIKFFKRGRRGSHEHDPLLDDDVSSWGKIKRSDTFTPSRFSDTFSASFGSVDGLKVN